MGWEVLGCVFVESKEEKLEAWAMRSRRSSRRVGLGSCSVTQSCLTLCNPMDYSTPGFLVLHGLPQLAQTHNHWVRDAFQPSHPLSSPSPPAFNLSQHQGLFQPALHIRWPKYWSLSFSISPSKEYSGLISFRIDCCDLFAVQGTCKSLLQHDSSKASILCSAFFMVRLSHPYMTTGKTTVLTRQTFVGKIMSLLFITLSRLVITLLPRSKCLLISWLQSPYAVTLEPPKTKSAIVSTVFSSIFHEVMGLMPWS